MSRNNKIFKAVTHVLLFVFLGTIAEAVSPKIWREDSQTAFLKGEPNDVSLTREGTVILAPSYKLVTDTDEDFVWALSVDANKTLYIGTGNEGRIYMLKPDSDRAELLFDSPETHIFSLAIGADGAVYAGTSPGGLIYRIAPGQEPTEFCQTGDSHVSALIARPGGGLYAGTGGDRGRVLKIDKQGKVVALYASKDPNVVSLALGAQGEVYAGTDNSGFVYRVRDQGGADVLYDAREKEIHSLSVGANGTIYATAMAQSGRSEGNGKEQKGSEQSGATLYAIQPSGLAMRLWNTDDPMLLDSAIDADGTVKVVTGKHGRVYRVWPDGNATLLAVLKDVNPWVMATAPKNALWIGCSGSGEIYRLRKGFAVEGQLTSEPYDFDRVSHWGRVSWQSETPPETSVAVQTRSGNSEEPDDTWSAWSEPITTSGKPITSRPGRFLQYRLVLKTRSENATPLVRSIRLAGLQDNVHPRILQIKAEADLSGNEGENPEFMEKGVWKIDWTAGDANGDDLIYTLYFKSIGESHWRLLKDDLKTSHYFWHTEAVPDGTVKVKVIASDRPDNPPEQALTAEVVSAPFDIDNSAPTVQLHNIRQIDKKVSVTGSIQDAATAIHKAAYSLNSDDWKVVFPTDQIFDSPTETLNFSIQNLKTGSYTLVVKAEDALGNIGVGKTVFEVK